jgi:hypothetical protein
MNPTATLGLMVATTLLALAAVAWVIAEVILFFTKDDK